MILDANSLKKYEIVGIGRIASFFFTWIYTNICQVGTILIICVKYVWQCRGKERV